MTTILFMRDVPPHVWYNVYQKWAKALRNGWNDKLWNQCALCDWLGSYHLGCNSCPIKPDEWCCGLGDISRLYYHDGIDGEGTWENNVKEFLKFIEPYCSKDVEDE